MARELANIRLDIWISQDFRDLTEAEQRLYFTLLTHDSLSYAGVAEWRPKRLAKLATDSTGDHVEEVGRSLESKRFILIDEDTEEVLVRSFLKHDGLLKQPRLTVSMVNAYGATASQEIRAVIIHELRKLVDAGHDWAGLKHERVVNLLGEPSAPIEDFISPKPCPTFDPNVAQDLGLHTGAEFPPSSAQGLGLHTTTATSTSSKEDREHGRKKPSTPLPPDWAPTKEHQARAEQKNLDLDQVAASFRAHAEAHDRRAVNWNAAFTQWLIKEKPGPPPSQQPSRSAWDYTEDDYRRAEEKLEQRATRGEPVFPF
ncbi:hypothetical protein ACFP47_10275 [Nesterenkonia lacusekhoensis]|uniref:Uncharacterized protein n=1 Tax=Nesterenkonia lacusekhoensis TaxID=150832 RepID=A0ABS4T545_9MICC|nr:hypothetical protein [Nesterenkonia lacusekhoensis]MBP2319587.1 hypothetical protein [Nesterenkonia lacusekhoensis]